MHRVVSLALVVALASVPIDARQRRVGPDAAVGSTEELLASAIVFDSTGRFEPGQGFIAHVRLSWEGAAGVKARVVYRETDPATLPERATADAARSAFYNFVVTAARVVPGASPSALPAALEYDIREAMSFGKGGQPWTFYVPVPRVMHRIPASDALPIEDVGRWTARARYTLADGMFASAPSGRRIDTDFATYESHYAVEGRDVVLERTLQMKKPAIPLAREAELKEFYAAVEADRRLEFAITPYPPGAASAADRLNERGLQAFDTGDARGAADQFQQALAADPQHRWAAYNLARAQLAMRDPAAAIASVQRALAIDAGHAYARILLGQALQAAGRLDDAEKALLDQVARFPWSAWSLGELAHYYDARHRPADALRYWQRTVDAAPREEETVLALGSTLLELGRSGEAVAAWAKGFAASRNGGTLNSAAWKLAERGVELDAARQLIERGLDIAAGPSIAPGSDIPPPPRPATMGLLGPMFDTAGWIAFKAGRVDEAVGWLRAAWRESEESEVAEHLGDALTAAKRMDDAARAYADALGREPGRAPAAAKLAAIQGAPSPDAAATARALTAWRTVVLDRGPAGAWTGEMTLTHDRTGTVVAIDKAGAAPADVLALLRTARVAVEAPPDRRNYLLERRVVVTCPGGNAGCTAVIRRPGDVQPR